MEDLHEIWPHRWITPKAENKESQIHGTGTFTKEPIAKDETVAVYGGIIVPSQDIEKYREKIGGIRGIQISDDFYICPTEKKGGLFNHSCEPNLGYNGQILIVAIKDIAADEELVFDYSFSESSFKPFTCTCKNPSCRKTIKETDWQNPEFQKKYGKYFTKNLRDKF